MRIHFLVPAMLCACFKIFAQLPQLYLNAKQSQALGVLSKSAVLVVVIENEKNDDDAALIGAVKEQWKIGEVKYMSGLEFSEKFKSQSLDLTKLYLFNNYTRSLKYSGGMVLAMNPDGISSIPAFQRGFYLTNDPVRLINSVKYKKAPPFLYFSADALTDQKQNPIKGFYALMIKNFNHDVRFCQDDENFNPKKKKKRNKRKNGIYYFRTDSLAEKIILLVKEQTEAKDKKTREEEAKKNLTAKKRQVLSSDQYEAKKTVVVFPEDIEYAVKKNDRDIMLINGDCLYAASDGSVVATLRGDSSNTGAWKRYGSLALSILAVTFFVLAIQS